MSGCVAKALRAWTAAIAVLATGLGACDGGEASSDEVVTRSSERVLVDPPDTAIAYLGGVPWGLANPMGLAVSVEEDHVYPALFTNGR